MNLQLPPVEKQSEEDIDSQMTRSEDTISLLPPSSADLSPLRSWRSYSYPIDSDTLSDIESPQDVSSFKRPKLKVISLGFIAYFAVAAGPFGIEDAVKAAGALPVLLAVIILPLTWGMPQALMTAELSTMMDENGGYILWVRRGLGEFAGWINAFNSVASNICDLPTYPVLFLSYIEALLSSQGYEISDIGRWAIKAAALFFVLLSNIVGMRAVALSSIAMSIFVLSPFFLEPIVWGNLDVSPWKMTAENIDWSLFLSTIIWNYQGWDSLGCIAGEVHDGGRTYPLAILFAMLLITLNYAVPVAVGISIIPDYSLWKEGFLETIAMHVANWLGIWVALGAIVATLGEFNVVMACSSRALWATASYRMLPACLKYEWDRFNTPVVAVLFQTLTTGILMSFSFSQLVILDTFFNNLTLLLEFCAYLRLKYIEPDTERPFEVPGKKLGAWIITLPKIILISGVLLAQELQVWCLAGIFNAIVIVAYCIWSRYHIHSPYSPSLPPSNRRKLSYNKI